MEIYSLSEWDLRKLVNNLAEDNYIFLPVFCQQREGPRSRWEFVRWDPQKTHFQLNCRRTDALCYDFFFPPNNILHTFPEGQPGEEGKSIALLGYKSCDIEALEKKQFNKLSEKYKISQSELKAINEVIKHLDPKPRTRLYSSQPSYIQPDVIVKKICDELTVIINEPDIPQIRVNKKYAHQLLNKSKNKSDSIKYIRRKILAAEHYVEALWLRRESLDMIANEIVNQQPKFFLEGIKELDPMTYEDVAANIKRDVSTVCRVVKGKFMDTTYGIFPLKWFFNSSVGENSSQKVKKELLRIIKSEDKNKPLSDRKIKNKLKEKNIEISVRGVNKYRNQLGIPSSRLRKE